MEAPIDEVDRSNGRRRWVLFVLAALALGALGVGAKLANDARLTFAYKGPTEPTAPGQPVTIRASAGECGPLVVSLHRESIFGFWSQTHSGNVVDGFTTDARPWWSLSSTSHLTPVPCSPGGSTTFVVPADVSATEIAACDADGACARIPIDP